MTVTSVERAIELLRAIEHCDGTLSGLARHTGLPVATVSRLMTTLERTGAVLRVEKVYRIGPVITELTAGDTVAADVLGVSMPHLDELAALTDETAGIAQRVGDGYLHLGQVATEHEVSVRDWTGFRNVAHAGCIGFALMAYWSTDEIDEYLGRDLEQFAENTVTDPAAIRARLEQVRTDGFLWTSEEYAADVTSVAAPVFDRRGDAVASLHVYGPTYRFPKPRQQRSLGRVVREQADAVSAVLGHRGTTTKGAA
ncbi:MAG: IclR family transcriptional regulator [Actinomycetota bacterium]